MDNLSSLSISRPFPSLISSKLLSFDAGVNEISKGGGGYLFQRSGTVNDAKANLRSL
jgi:hypothetical protein